MVSDDEIPTCAMKDADYRAGMERGVIVGTIGIVLRVIPMTVKTVDELGLPATLNAALAAALAGALAQHGAGLRAWAGRVRGGVRHG